MATKSYSEQLEEVQTAITGILTGGQSVSFNGRSVTHANLDSLYKHEQRLQALVDRASRGGARVRGATVVR